MSTNVDFDALFNDAIEGEMKNVKTQFSKWNWDAEKVLAGYFVGIHTVTPKEGESFNTMRFVTLDGRCVEVAGSKALLTSLAEDDELGYRIYRIEYMGMTKMKKGEMRTFNVRYAAAAAPIQAYLYQ
jgi:hypothetical protein